MKWLSQFSLVMRSSVTSLREKIEDPERMLHQLILDMEEELDRVRCSVAEAVADEIQMRKRGERERSEADKWMERATSAMKRGDEAAAKAALDQKVSATQRADRYADDHAKQQKEVLKLQDAVRDLEDKIRQAKQKKTLLTARMARASSTQKINAAMERSCSKSAFAQFNRMEQKVEREEALSEAWERMDGKDPDAADLERQFEAQERDEKLAAELAQLKAQVSAE
ncbi:MAG: PspA/IM30 family protein [Planctomycetaceae bacterium]